MNLLDAGELRAVPFEPGRFANLITRSGVGGHALQMVREEVKSSFVLTLAPDGSATLCRGWRLLSFNDGPSFQSNEHIHEQLGYRGRWRASGESVEVELTLDDGLCGRVARYSKLVSNHAARWTLCCAAFVRTAPPLQGLTLLACRPEGFRGVFGEDEPHLADALADDPCILLGQGNGLVIAVVRDPTGREPAAVRDADLSPEPIRDDEWALP